ncbi:MAG: hypothetical protein IPM50_08460 [Acidobacteriota bacterium]|nr:MAG: hypothetical protein IPM50_08460 [Acidobacteriota bacterium]
MTLGSVLLLIVSGLSILFPPAGAPAGFGGIAEAYLAKDNGDGTAGEAANEFDTDDIPIYCVIMLDTDEVVTVKMELIAVDVKGVRANSKVLNASYTTKRGETRVNFTGRPQGRWTPGKYRVDLFVNGVRSEDLPFTINGAAKNTLTPKPAPSSVKRFRRP